MFSYDPDYDLKRILMDLTSDIDRGHCENWDLSDLNRFGDDVWAAAKFFHDGFDIDHIYGLDTKWERYAAARIDRVGLNVWLSNS